MGAWGHRLVAPPAPLTIPGQPGAALGQPFTPPGFAPPLAPFTPHGQQHLQAGSGSQEQGRHDWRSRFAPSNLQQPDEQQQQQGRDDWRIRSAPADQQQQQQQRPRMRSAVRTLLGGRSSPGVCGTDHAATMPLEAVAGSYGDLSGSRPTGDAAGSWVPVAAVSYAEAAMPSAQQADGLMRWAVTPGLTQHAQHAVLTPAATADAWGPTSDATLGLLAVEPAQGAPAATSIPGDAFGPLFHPGLDGGLPTGRPGESSCAERTCV